MKKTLYIGISCMVMAVICTGCGPRSKLHRTHRDKSHWYDGGERGYNKESRRVIRQWDRNFR